jgi:hypothetical protein
MKLHGGEMAVCATPRRATIQHPRRDILISGCPIERSRHLSLADILSRRIAFCITVFGLPMLGTKGSTCETRKRGISQEGWRP